MNVRNLALFNLAIDSKLRACDLVSIRVSDVTQGYKVIQRATVMQKKTKRPVQFEYPIKPGLRSETSSLSLISRQASFFFRVA
jgi:hypothetical protein